MAPCSSGAGSTRAGASVVDAGAGVLSPRRAEDAVAGAILLLSTPSASIAAARSPISLFSASRARNFEEWRRLKTMGKAGVYNATWDSLVSCLTDSMTLSAI
jgi:hypothetical protein